MLSLRTICAGLPHDDKECKKKVYYGYPYYGEKRNIDEKRLQIGNGFLNILMKNGFVMQYTNYYFHFYTSVLLQQRKFFKTKFPVTSVIQSDGLMR